MSRPKIRLLIFLFESFPYYHLNEWEKFFKSNEAYGDNFFNRLDKIN